MALTAEMARAATRLKLVQVPGAGVDRIDRSALPEGALLANANGHETGIAEYVVGAMLVLTREFSSLDRALRKGEWQSQWAVGTPPPPVWPELAGQTVGIQHQIVFHRSGDIAPDRTNLHVKGAGATGDLLANPAVPEVRRPPPLHLLAKNSGSTPGMPTRCLPCTGKPGSFLSVSNHSMRPSSGPTGHRGRGITIS